MSEEEATPDTSGSDAAEAASNGKSEPSEGRVLLKKLTVGFTYLRELRDGDDEVEACQDLSPPGSRHSITSCTVVNFIDPGTSKSPGGSKQVPIFNKLTSYFEDEYGSTLRDVPYKHVRSGESQVIDRILVYPTLQGAPASTTQGRGILDRSTSGLSDPSEWHNGPYCHVYIAACESIEHYRTKVKPSLQAFVSQIEQAAANVTPSNMPGESTSPAEAASTAGAGSSYSANYVIVFVPTGDKSGSGAGSGGTAGGGKRFGAALGTRFAAARQRMRANPSEESGNSLHASGTDSNTSAELELDLSDPNAASSLGQLSKLDKDLLRRFTVDFPNGHVCIMTTLADTADEEDAENDTSILRKSEWASFQRSLGMALVDGFKDRCQRYDEELRRLDLQRAAAMNPASGESTGTTGAAKFSLVHYFLVKESLAFTFEQMCLPSEALLQYNELRALLPDLNAEAIHRIPNKEQKQWESLSEMAIAGDTMGFRRRLADLDMETQSSDAAMEVLDPIAHILAEYLFSREVSLRTNMGDAVKVLSCCRSFVENMFQFKLATIPSSLSISGSVGEDESQRLLVEATRWAFDFCWNVKKASECYLAEDVYQLTDDGVVDPAHQAPVDTAFVRELCGILGFARVRFLKLGDISLDSDNPARLESTALGKDVMEPWGPWQAPALSTDVENEKNEDDDANVEPVDFLDSALSSSGDFRKRYMDLARIMIDLNHLSGRQRTAAKFETEMLEIYIERGDKAGAIESLKSIVKSFSLDHWNVCHFVLLFRLACFQRKASPATEYLETLVNCFSVKLSVSAPPKAQDALQSDLEAVLQDPSTDGSRFVSAPVFDASLGLKGLDPKLNLRKMRSTLKKVFSVGEEVLLSLDLSSHLPKGIDVDAVTISFVPFQVYVASLEDSVPLKDEDTVKRLSLQAPVSIQPGKNEYEFDWIPMSPGQYILSSVSIRWRGSHFVYQTKDIQKMAVRIDVVPCEPTQSLEVQPAFLLPGHEQPLRLEFKAGSDIVKEGSLQLACSPGLLLQPPKESPEAGKWMGACNVPLPPCSPGETVVFDAQVKSISTDPTAADSEAQRLHAEVSTSFLFDHPGGSDLDSDEVTPMTTVLESVIPSLGKPTLLVENAETVLISSERAIVCVSLLCNLPVAFTVKSWKIDLPPMFSLEESGDLNSSLSNSKIVAGERLSFGFACSIQDRHEDASSSSRASLHVVLEDEHGTVFDEVLALSIKPPSIPQATLSDPPVVGITVSSSATKGPVNTPVNLSYVVDMSPFSQLPKGTILYQVEVDDDWILSGKAEGVLDEGSGCRLEFVAVPVRPGTLSTYPTLKVFFESDDPSYGLVPLKTSVAKFEPFCSTCPTGHMTVAFPVQV